MENSIQCILVVLLAALEISQSQSCPKCSSSVPCVSSLTECPDKQYLVQNANLCDCCPGCKGGAGELMRKLKGTVCWIHEKPLMYFS